MEDKAVLIAIALIVICIIEIVALWLGHNGTLLMAVFVLIGGLVGYSFSPLVDKARKK